MTETRSPETYIGYSRAKNFVSPGGAVKDVESPLLDRGPEGRLMVVGRRLDGR